MPRIPIDGVRGVLTASCHAFQRSAASFADGGIELAQVVDVFMTQRVGLRGRYSGVALLGSTRGLGVWSKL